MEHALFRNMMYDLFNRLQSKRTRVIKDRQIELLEMLLEVEKIDWYQFLDRAKVHYKHVANFSKTLGRDIGSLVQLGASEINKVGDKKWNVGIRPQWPQEVTESDSFEKIKKDAQGQDLSVPAIKGMEMSNYYKTGFNDRC